MQSIETLKQDVEACRVALRVAEKNLADAQIEAMPAKPGDIIKDSDGAIYRVTGFRVKWGNPRVVAAKRLNGGQFSNSPREVWRKWTKVEG